MDLLQEAAVKTLAYADVFNYPLTSEQLYLFLIIGKSISATQFKSLLLRIRTDAKLIETNEEYFFLKGRKSLVTLRKKRKKWSREKVEIARRIGGRFKLVPWIKMVGITGALAMANTDKEDDIDLIVVTAKNRLWLTRLFLILLTEFMNVRRRPNEKNSRDKICLNMFLDEEHLTVPEKERNLFTAHEVCQVKLIWDENGTYKRFLWENQWTSKFLPNAVKISSKFKVQSSKFQFNNKFFDFLEKIIFKFQLVYMRKRRTIEKIEEGRVLFHPGDCSGWVLREYNNRVKEQERLEQE